MKVIVAIICATLVSGCGVELATTAATTATMKKQEVEAAQHIKALAQQKIDQAAQSMQQRDAQRRDVEK